MGRENFKGSGKGGEVINFKYEWDGRQFQRRIAGGRGKSQAARYI